MRTTSVRSFSDDAPPPPLEPEVEIVLYPINSTISLANAGEESITDEPLFAVYSPIINLTPFTKTSINPTV